MDLGHKLGEVIESSNSEFLVQCYELDAAPALGSLVKTASKGLDILGIVYLSGTHPIEPTRRVVIRGQNTSSEADIFKTNPQLVKLLCTDFRVLITGYIIGDRIYQYLPPSPASIYSFVYPCSHDDVRKFTTSMNFLNLLIDSRLQVNTDEIIAAFLRYASQVQASPQDFLVGAGKELAWLLSDDIRRLDSILKRLRQ